VIQNPGFLPDHPQNWITGSLCHTLKISERSVRNFLSYLANRQTDKQTKTGKNITSMAEVIILCSRSTQGHYGFCPTLSQSWPSHKFPNAPVHPVNKSATITYRGKDFSMSNFLADIAVSHWLSVSRFDEKSFVYRSRPICFQYTGILTSDELR